MKTISNEKQPFVQREIDTVLICFNEKETLIQDQYPGYEYDSARTSFPYTYEVAVSDIIKAKYSNDLMLAIINNHLLEEDNPEHEQEFREMLEYRRTAKAIAKQLMTIQW